MLPNMAAWGVGLGSRGRDGEMASNSQADERRLPAPSLSDPVPSERRP